MPKYSIDKFGGKQDFRKTILKKTKNPDYLLKKISISYILKMFVVRCPLQKIIDSFLFNKYLTSSVLNIIITIHRATFYCDYPTSTNVTY